MQTSSGVSRTVSLRSADGVVLEATHTPARGPAKVVIVLVPGFSGWSQKPGVARAAAVFAENADVLQVDLRGHGRSQGLTTLADREVLDVDAAVAHARSLGLRYVVTVGFSMGGAAVIRHAALVGEQIHGHRVNNPVDAVVSVSTGDAWYIRDTRPMRRLHWLVLTRFGRLVARRAFHLRIDPKGWTEEPLSPLAAAARLRLPLLVVHGDQDSYLKEKHAYALSEAAGGPTQLWMEHGFGHAEEAADPTLLRRIGAAVPRLAEMSAGLPAEVAADLPVDPTAETVSGND
jgi:pimeloyl-ACP methyl ester carboxylesterase